MTDIKTQLSEDLAAIEWKDLIAHAQRDALIVVSPSLDLLDVGIAIANDRVTLVQDWINQQLIGKPTLEQLSTWNASPTTVFSTSIVQPFVLIQTK